VTLPSRCRHAAVTLSPRTLRQRRCALCGRAGLAQPCPHGNVRHPPQKRPASDTDIIIKYCTRVTWRGRRRWSWARAFIHVSRPLAGQWLRKGLLSGCRARQGGARGRAWKTRRAPGATRGARAQARARGRRGRWAQKKKVRPRRGRGTQVCTPVRPCQPREPLPREPGLRGCSGLSGRPCRIPIARVELAIRVEAVLSPRRLRRQEHFVCLPLCPPS
jgi:hypothetical protein